MAKTTLCKRIAELRKEQGLTQQQFANIPDVDNTTISAWELGKIDVSTAVIVKLTQIFDVSADFLLGIEK